MFNSKLLLPGILDFEVSSGEFTSEVMISNHQNRSVNGYSDSLLYLLRDFEVIARLDTNVEVDYFVNGGILKYVLRKVLEQK